MGVKQKILSDRYFLLQFLSLAGILKSAIMSPLLEVIVCSIEDAKTAAEAGAGRLEVVAKPEIGGLTPPPELVRQILTVVRIPVRVMLRETEGFTVVDDSEKRSLAEIARVFGELPIDGIVLGFLRAGELDEELVATVLNLAPNHKATFHRAFEDVVDSARAISQLKRFRQFDSILTSAPPGDWGARAESLRELQRMAQPEMQILVGGGLDETSIKIIREKSGIAAFHVGRAARKGAQITGAIDKDRIRRLVQLIESSDCQ